VGYNPLYRENTF